MSHAHEIATATADLTRALLKDLHAREGALSFSAAKSLIEGTQGLSFGEACYADDEPGFSVPLLDGHAQAMAWITFGSADREPKPEDFTLEGGLGLDGAAFEEARAEWIERQLAPIDQHPLRVISVEPELAWIPFEEEEG